MNRKAHVDPLHDAEVRPDLTRTENLLLDADIHVEDCRREVDAAVARLREAVVYRNNLRRQRDRENAA